MSDANIKIPPGPLSLELLQAENAQLREALAHYKNCPPPRPAPGEAVPGGVLRYRIEVLPGERTRFLATMPDLGRLIQTLVQTCVHIWSTGPVPAVSVVADQAGVRYPEHQADAMVVH